MKKHITVETLRRAPKPTFRPATLADVVLSGSQRLRADETVTKMTVALPFAAKFAQVEKGGQR